MVPDVVLPPPVRPGDRVAVVSPSWCAPAQFPEVHEQALSRIRDLGLEPVELPFTRVQGTPAERAEDLMRAFEDDSIAAVMATIGGDDQITVLRHLDHARMLAHPKRFLGFSDNTNLSNWLFFHGIGGVYGGSTAALGPGPSIEVEHLTSLRAALFGGDLQLSPPARTRDYGLDWGTPAALVDPSPARPATPWRWSGPTRPVTGLLWGGCLEIVEWTLAVGHWVHPASAYAGCVLALEASEEMPSPTACSYMLRNLGERGILGAASALLWGRPPVSTREQPRTEEEAAGLRAERREVVLRAVADYNPGLVVVLDVDFGHTSPQLLVPYGGRVTVDGERQVLTAHFG
ncbi:S66 peptidase family protein [Nocardioides sp.]|uniref:S66 family peptidase n=1 Tax=Nocardioides sp. TaxID=35761 RepID=UPI002BB7E2D7|nr:S66 peptidase family protein [Nocardioides sp.]HXH78524.1 S66 peptidase family protein [Nocardioides sp.]